MKRCKRLRRVSRGTWYSCSLGILQLSPLPCHPRSDSFSMEEKASRAPGTGLIMTLTVFDVNMKGFFYSFHDVLPRYHAMTIQSCDGALGRSAGEYLVRARFEVCFLLLATRWDRQLLLLGFRPQAWPCLWCAPCFSGVQEWLYETIYSTWHLSMKYL